MNRNELIEMNCFVTDKSLRETRNGRRTYEGSQRHLRQLHYERTVVTFAREYNSYTHTHSPHLQIYLF